MSQPAAPLPPRVTQCVRPVVPPLAGQVAFAIVTDRYFKGRRMLVRRLAMQPDHRNRPGRFAGADHGSGRQPQIQLNAVTPGGSLLVTQWSPPPNLGDIVESHLTAGVRTVASSATRLSPQFSWMVHTTDGRTVVISRQSLLGQQLVAQRCT
jgi:hypothetical protein